MSSAFVPTSFTISKSRSCLSNGRWPFCLASQSDETSDVIAESSGGIYDTLKAYPKDFLIGGLGIGLSCLEVAINQPASNSFFNPVMEACSTNSPSLQPYIGQLGGMFVCAVTQLMFNLTQNLPAGFIAWMTTILGSMPALFLIGIEGGRKDAKPILNAPVVFMFLSQLLGVSVAMTGIWLPIYLWGRCKDGYVTPVAVGRLVSHVSFVQIPTFILSLLCFAWDPNQNPLWDLAAGIMAGPLAALFGIPQSFFSPPTDDPSYFPKEESLSPESKTLIGLATVAFLTWLAIVGVAWNTYGTNLSQLANEIWFQASPAVQFLAADAVFVYIGVLLALAASSIPFACYCLAATPFLGPGAAPLLSMFAFRQQLQIKQNSPSI